MAIAEFPEKTFEAVYYGELARGRGSNARLFSPSQVFENLVGFDAAVDPRPSHLVWEVLNLPRPRGVTLLPSHWAGSPLGEPRSAPLPSNPVSLILQYKRPEYLYGARAGQWKLWGTPYYRFKRDDSQHAVLKRLELGVADQAVVRYASPAFHTLAEFELAQAGSTVIRQTGHVAPSALGSHHVWTYREPGTNGRGNSDGPWRLFQSFEGLFDYLDPEPPEQTTTEVAVFEGLEQHLSSLGQVARDREPLLRRAVEQWRRGLAETAFPLARQQALVDYVTVQSLLSRVGAGWLIADGNEVRPR